MSDFLSNLATRTLEPKPSVRPRLPSLFDAPQSLPSLPPLAAPFSEAFDEINVETPNRQARSLRRSVSIRDSATPQRATEIPSAFSQPYSPRDETDSPRETSDVSPFVKRPVVPALQVEIQEPAPQSAPEIAAPAAPFQPANIISVAAERNSQTAFRSNDAPGAIIPVPTAPQPQREAREVAAKLPVPSTSPVVTPTMKPASPASVFAEPRGEAPPQPTIHVTIGRIEVRASTTPARFATSQKAKPTNAAMSLDDYLRQREGGK